MQESNNIRIDNVAETVRAIRAFAPDIKERMNREIRKAMTDVKRGAEARYPKGAYSVNISAKKILGSVAAASGGKGGVGKSWGESAPGIRAAIFEFAGSRQPGQTPQAQGLIRSLNNRYGSPGRFLWAAWDEKGSDAKDRIEAAVKAAERELNARLEASGEAF